MDEKYSDLLLYSIKDIKGGTYSPPFHAATDATALRQVTMTARDGKTILSQFPADFELWCVGRFDQRRGETDKLSYFLCQISTLISYMEASDGMEKKD